jgi:hypothetical protein
VTLKIRAVVLAGQTSTNPKPHNGYSFSQGGEGQDEGEPIAAIALHLHSQHNVLDCRCVALTRLFFEKKAGRG